MPLKIYTAQYRYSGEDRLDITARSNDPLGRLFAPTWEMVMRFKRDNDEGLYIRQYHNNIIIPLFNKHGMAPWQELLVKESVTAVCFCPSGAFCHRHLFSYYLCQLGAVCGGEITF